MTYQDTGTETGRQFSRQAAAEARQYSVELLNGSYQEALALANARLAEWQGADKSIFAMSLSAMVMAAQTAGVLTGKDGYYEAMAVVSATGVLDNEAAAAFEIYVNHVNSEVAQETMEPDDVARFTMENMMQYRRSRPELGEQADDLELATIGYAAGACLAVPEPANFLQDMLSRMIESRTASDIF